MLAVGHRHRTEIGTRGAVFVHVPLGDHGHRRGRGAQPVRIGPAVLDTARVGVDGQAGHHLTEPELEALVEGPVSDDNLRDTGGDGQSRLLHGRGCGAAAIADLAEELQVPDPGGRGPRRSPGWSPS